MRIHTLGLAVLFACGGPPESHVATAPIEAVHTDAKPAKSDQPRVDAEIATREVLEVSDPTLPELSKDPDTAAKDIEGAYRPWLDTRWQAAGSVAKRNDEPRTMAGMWITIPERVIANVNQHAGKNATDRSVKVAEGQLLTRWLARARASLLRCQDTCQELKERADAVAKHLAVPPCNCQPGDPLCSCR